MKQYHTYISLPIISIKYPYFMITLLNMNMNIFTVAHSHEHEYFYGSTQSTFEITRSLKKKP